MSDENKDAVRPRGGTLYRALLELLEKIPIVGKAIRLIFEAEPRRLSIFLLATVFLLLVYPLFLPLLTSYLINHGALGVFEDSYRGNIREAFKFDQALEVSNRGIYQRLDYYYTIDVIVDRSIRTNWIPIVSRQRTEFQVERASVRTLDPEKCAVPIDLLAEGADLLLVKLGGEKDPFMTIANNEDYFPVPISSKDWDRLGVRTKDNKLKVEIMPTPAFRRLCQGLVIDARLNIKVFKDLVPASVEYIASAAK